MQRSGTHFKCDRFDHFPLRGIENTDLREVGIGSRGDQMIARVVAAGYQPGAVPDRVSARYRLLSKPKRLL